MLPCESVIVAGQVVEDLERYWCTFAALAVRPGCGGTEVDVSTPAGIHRLVIREAHDGLDQRFPDPQFRKKGLLKLPDIRLAVGSLLFRIADRDQGGRPIVGPSCTLHQAWFVFEHGGSRLSIGPASPAVCPASEFRHRLTERAAVRPLMTA